MDGSIPIPNQKAVTVADKLFNEVFMRFGIPQSTSLRPRATVQIIINIRSVQAVGNSEEQDYTILYHPQCDGMVEKFNRTLLSMLAAHCKNNPWDWEGHLQTVCSLTTQAFMLQQATHHIT